MRLSTTSRASRASGWTIFTIVWAGQLVSLLGSGVSGFALGLWVLQGTGSVTQFALISACTVLPRILLSPIAGAFADRWNRRRTMIAAEATAAAATAFVAIMLAAGRLDVWHIYAATSVMSSATAFQWPAYSASITMLVTKARVGHASGMVQIAQGVAQTLAPALAGGLMLLQGGLQAVLLVDFCTYVFAIATLVAVRIPDPPAGEARSGASSVLDDVVYGWRYLRARPGLIGLLVMLAACNFLLGAIMILVNPLVLSFASPQVLGTVMTTAGLGMFAGSAAMSVWGGPKQRVRGIVGFLVLGGVALVPAALPPSAPLIAAGAFLFLLGIPIVSGCTQAILQTKVAPSVQGRVFALTGMIAAAAMPVAYLVAGPVADAVFEPWLAANGALAPTLGRFIGVGPGRGIALAFVASGLLLIAIALAGFLHPRIRNVERELADATPANEDERQPAPVEWRRLANATAE
jgi:DHA3 family macrolide efflux protein-like MFS transporter